MCGIFGYIGKDNNSVEKAILGLKDLEYRGYDSWGVAIKDGNNFFIKKSTGKISDVKIQDFEKIKGTISIGHSRWATHGKVLEKNAHPHTNEEETIAVVHNGIIENVKELKKKIGNYQFKSDTDTEIIPHLIDYYLKQNLDLKEAFLEGARRLEGRFAFLLVSKNQDVILAARNGSPLILGKGENEYFLASDIPAFLSYTNTVNYIDDGQCVEISTRGPEFFELKTGKKILKKNIRIDWGKDLAKKGKHEHFMLKEILEQKEVLAQAVNQDTRQLTKVADIINSSKKVLITGSGTAGHVGMTARYLFNVIANKQVSFVSPSEFSLYEKFMDKDCLLVAVSQSGETADVLEAIEQAKNKGAKILSVLNTKGSSIERLSDFSFLIKAGPEIAVASTKATSSQVAVLFLIAYVCAGKEKKGKNIVVETMGQINEWLNPKFLEHIKNVANKVCSCEHIYVIGRSYNYPVALEAALKIQEISYMHAEGFAGGEIKHGPIALISPGTPVLAIAGEDKSKKDILNNIEELKARGAYIIAISKENHPTFDQWIHIPGGEYVSPIISLIPTQIFAYYLAILRGNDPDKPRNLAKSVTVK